MVAAKYYDDKYYPNAYYAKVGGISTYELNALEHLFLEYIDFELYFKAEEIEAHQSNLKKCFPKDNENTTIFHDHS